MSINKLVKELNQNNQDFEFYPTTNEIIEAMYQDLKTNKPNNKYCYSLLDIGAGNGKVYTTLKTLIKEDKKANPDYRHHIAITKYLAIEKSEILQNTLPKEAFIVGSDFYENTLIDKDVNIIFSNPPYSEYIEWSRKIIDEANSDIIYLVIPQRWGKHKELIKLIKERNFTANVVGNFSFEESEDRKARAKVVLLRLTAKNYTNYSYYKKDNFNRWFEKTFKIKAKQHSYDYHSWEDTRKEQEELEKTAKNALVKGNFIETMVTLYNQKLDKLLSNYTKLGELDQEILAELNVDLETLKSNLKDKITNLKKLYWREVFNNLDKITERLTAKSRDELYKQMTENNVDFTEKNIYAIVIWVIKNANQYFNTQLLDLFDSFCNNSDNYKFYKSNEHFSKSDFRYTKPNVPHYLDYRVILESYFSDWDIRDGKLPYEVKSKINDVLVVVRNLGFDVTSLTNDLFLGEKYYIFKQGKREILKKGTKTLKGKIEEVYCHTNIPNENNERVIEKDGIIYIYDKEHPDIKYQYKIKGSYYHPDSIYTQKDILIEFKTFKNGNTHFKFNKDVMAKFNLEVGKLRKWLNSKEEAKKEIEDIIDKQIEEFWDTMNFQIKADNKFILLSYLS